MFLQRPSQQTLALHPPCHPHLSSGLDHSLQPSPASRGTIFCPVPDLLRDLYCDAPLYWYVDGEFAGAASRSFGTAIQLGLGNCANFVSSNVFITTQALRYPVGFGAGMLITAFSFVVMFLVMFIFSKHNKNIEVKRAALGPGEELDKQVDYLYVF